MSIRSDNLKFYKALLNNDRDDSGGMPTGTEIPNVDNSIFPDISPLDRAMGRIFMRKVSPQVVTSDTEQYLGAHSIITKIPKDEKLAVFLFDTGEKSRYHDIRSEASSDFEAYRQRSVRYNGVMWDTHYEGTQALTLFQSVDGYMLEPNTVIYIEEKNNPSTNQYLMVTSIEDRGVQKFNDSTGDFVKRVVVLQLSQPLNADYTGNTIIRQDTFTPNTLIHTTATADASRIYSSKALISDVAIGDLSVNIGTPYIQAVPASTSYEAVTGQTLDNGLMTIGETRSHTLSGYITNWAYHDNKTYTLAPFDWETLEVKIGSTTIVASNEKLVVQGTSVEMGLCSPSSGIISFNGTAPSGNLWVSYTVAPYHSKAGSTYATEISPSNQSLVYTHQFIKPFVRGSVVVKYTSLGELYTLYDTELGTLEGVGGRGDIDLLNRTVTVTLDSIPDDGSMVLWQASSGSDEVSYEGSSEFYITINSSNPDRDVSKITLSWVDTSGTTHTHTGDESSEGYLIPTTYGFKFYPTNIMAKGTSIDVVSITSKSLISYSSDLTTEFDGNAITCNIGGSVLANSFSVSAFRRTYSQTAINDINGYSFYPINQSQWYLEFQKTVEVRYVDDGNGNIVLKDRESLTPVVCGTIDYATGDVVFYPKYRTVTRSYDVDTKLFSYNEEIWNIGGYSLTSTTFYGTGDNVINPALNSSFNVNAISLPLYNEDIPIDGKLTNDHITFDFGGDTYISQNGIVGTTFNSNQLNPKGSLDAYSGIVVLDAWDDGVTNAVPYVYAHYQGNEDQFDEEISWYIKGAPIQHGSLAGTVVFADETIAHFSTDNTDVISSVDSDIVGTIDTTTGFAKITSATLGMSVKSLTYTAVIQRVIPVNPDVIKMDTVRLPIDGKMSVYRAGDLVIILHNQVTSATYATGDVVNMRPETNYVTIKDSTDAYVDVSKYTIDWGAKTITWDDVSGVAMPVTIMDRVENLRVVSRVRNTGELVLLSGVSYPFPANETLVCSALIHTTMYASHTTPFDQQTTSDWSDSVTGNPAIGNWNVTLKPITLTNQGTIDERWMIVFRSTGNVDVIGEKLGYVLQDVDPQINIAPINPFQQVPYVVIEGGSFVGFTSGQVIRFNTKASAQPYWLMESVSVGDATDTSIDANKLCVEFRGSVDV